MCTLGGCLFIDCRRTFIFYKIAVSVLFFLSSEKSIKQYIYLWNRREEFHLRISLFLSKSMDCRAENRVSMQQSRLEHFFSSKKTSPNEKKSTMNNNNKRLSTNDDPTKTMKRIKSDDEPIDSQVSLNDFYLEKFLFILSTLLEHHQSLFNDDELNLFQRFQTLNCSSKIIFVRLLMRRCKWIRQSSINYGLNDDLSPLVENGFLQDSNQWLKSLNISMNRFILVSTLENLDEALRLLTAEEMRQFSKRFHCQSKASQSKKVSIENLKNLSQQYKSVFGSTTTNNRDHLLLKEFRSISQ